MSEEADALLQEYFNTNQKKIVDWFNIISPNGENLDELKNQLKILVNKSRN